MTPRKLFRGNRLFALITVLLAPSTALAGPVETLRDVVFHPSDSKTFAAVYAEAGGGVLITRNGGKHFDLVCSSAIEGMQELGSTVPQTLFTNSGHLLVGTFDGLFRDDAHGCAFQRVPELSDAYVRQLVRDPDEASVIYALTSSGGANNAVFRSKDDGASWSVLGKTESSFFRQLTFTTRSDGTRLMLISVCQLASSGTGLDCSLRTSDDHGATFQDTAFPAGEMLLLGADEREPERLYAIASPPGKDGDVLYVNDSLGAPGAWKKLAQLGDTGSFLPADDGGFWVVDTVAKVLLRGNAAGTAAKVQTGTQNTTCVARAPQGGAFFVGEGFRLFRATSDLATQGDPILDFNHVMDLVSCDADAGVAAACEVQLDYGWCGETHFPAAPVCKTYQQASSEDAGPDAAQTVHEPDAGADAGAQRSASKPAANCHAGNGPGAHFALAAWALCALAWLERSTRAVSRASKAGRVRRS